MNESTNNYLLIAEKVRKEFGGLVATDDVDFTIPREKDEDAVQHSIEATFDYCYCGKAYGHRGFHRKPGDDD